MATSDARRLGDHLTSVGFPCRVADWKPLAGGRSATTVRVRLEPTGPSRRPSTVAVLHLHAAGGPLAGLTDAAVQFRLLTLLGETLVRAPRVLWEIPADVLGRAGFLTAFVAGDVPDPFRRSGREYLAGHAPNGPLAEDFVAAMVEIHRVPVEGLEPAFGAHPDPRPHGQREHERWSRVLGGSSAFSHDPILAYADAWLASRRPEREEVGLVHGDYRIGNLVLDEGRVVGVLDWELAERGEPLYDLATVCSPALRTNDLACGLWEPNALVERYEQLTGRAVCRDALRFFGVLGTFKITCLWVNASLPFSSGDDDLAAVRAGFSVLDCRPMLAESLGLPVVPGNAAGRDEHQRALAMVLDRVREAGREHPHDALPAAVAVLRGMVRPQPRERVGFADDVRSLADAAGAIGARSGSAARDLATAARVIMRAPDVAADESHPLHRRLRALVAEAVHGSAPAWPRVPGEGHDATSVPAGPVGSAAI